MGKVIEKKVVLYHLTLESDIFDNFSDVLERISQENETDRRIVIKPDNFIVKVSQKDNERFLITIQRLTDEDLPKMADGDNGENEEELSIPDGKKLSYKNVFIYDKNDSMLAMAKLQGHPQNGKFTKCITELVKHYAEPNNKFNIHLAQITDNDLREKIKNAKNITMAQFTSVDFCDSSNINEKDYEKYKGYLSGQGYRKTTKISGIGKSDIKKIIEGVIEDFMSNNELVNSLNITMEIDGEKINFNRYFKQYKILVSEDINNGRYVDYDDLENKITDVLNEFIENKNGG